ncbi:LysR substrate-binding domain-containing protein [Paenibacillus oralis]|uniref:LysR substrate-binding domain-containing protein n=1 Tax=Paenibacillus oralis TaxID=2490856 RepID=UPI0015AA3007|nr:LysR substrate-binding domain-containing protein [Paenibacillus oralis]
MDDLACHAGGPIAIRASYTFGEYILPDVIAKLKKEYLLIRPSIIIHNTKEIIDLVISYQLDIGIIEGCFNDYQIHSEVISEDNMVIDTSPRHPLLKKNRNCAFQT